MLFGDLPRDPAPSAWDRLDDALLAWLQALPGQTEALVERPGGVRRFITEAGEGFRAVHRLELPRCSAWLAAELPQVAAWAGRFVENSAFDLADVVMGAAANVQRGDGCRFWWLRACAEAANRRLRHRVDAALLGLASMPGAEPMPRREVLLGLARWGEGMDGANDFRAEREFVRRVRQLKAAFPQPRDFWLSRWGDLTLSPQVRGWLEGVWPELKGGKAGRSDRVPKLPASVQETVKGLNDRWRRFSGSPLLAEMDTLVALTERYALATGDSHFLVTSSGNLGRKVRDGAPGHVLAWMRRALLWSPSNEQAWSLRADCLARLGRRDEAEAVLWEARRRLPHDAPLRHQLAQMLTARAADAAAERLLREALERDAEHEHSHVDLARLLWRRDRGGEARDRLDGFARRRAAIRQDNPIVLYTLALLDLAAGRDAAWACDRYRACFGDDQRMATLERLRAAGAAGVAEVRRQHLAEPHAPAGRRLPCDDAAHALDEEAAEAPLLRRAAWGAEADLLFGLGEKQAARDCAGRALAADAGDALATVAMALGDDSFRHALRGRLHHFPGLLPVRLAALADRDCAAADDWLLLREDFTDPDEVALIALIRAGLAGGRPDETLERWAKGTARAGDAADAFLRTQVARNLGDDDALAPLAHDALLRATEPPGVVPLVA